MNKQYKNSNEGQEPPWVGEPYLDSSYSYADYIKWHHLGEMVELIRGKIFRMSPAPTTTHQKVSLNLVVPIYQFFKKNKLCQVFEAPFDVRLPKSPGESRPEQILTVVQPDICVICNLKKIDENGCLGPPDWIIEILSKYTSKKDLKDKFTVYEESGVLEYWIVHPYEQTLSCFVLGTDRKYVSISPVFYTKGQCVSPSLFPELEIDLDEIFDME